LLYNANRLLAFDGHEHLIVWFENGSQRLPWPYFIVYYEYG
jgi:hypothetical protein